MIGFYVKQAFALLRQNPLFSMLYMMGTGLAICFTVVMAVAYYVKLAPLYPEYNRNRMYYMGNIALVTKDSSTYQSGFSIHSLKDWMYPLKNAEAVSGIMIDGVDTWVRPDDGMEFRVGSILTDPAFFKIYDFRFLEGAPFTQADLESGIRTVVISQGLAHRLFGTEKGVVGKNVKVNHVDYRVCGVLNPGTTLFSNSYSDMYMPYTTDESHQNFFYFEPIGSFYVRILVKNEAQHKALLEELRSLEANVNQQHKDEWTVVVAVPRSHTATIFNKRTISFGQLFKQFLPIILVLLLIPALNLSGMISSRMEERLSEMGVRKSFGASRCRLLLQVMWENLLLTLFGGLLGLLFAWGLLYFGRGWVFALFEEYPSSLFNKAATVTGEMLFSPAVFIVALLVCLAINLLSALLPAWNSLRKPIVYSLNEKK